MQIFTVREADIDPIGGDTAKQQVNAISPLRLKSDLPHQTGINPLASGKLNISVPDALNDRRCNLGHHFKEYSTEGSRNLEPRHSHSPTKVPPP